MNTKVSCTPPDRRLEGKYVNYFRIGFNAYEFIIDFGQYFPEHDPASLSTRIVTSPAYAKALLELLQQSIAQYNETYGSIESETPGE